MGSFLFFIYICHGHHFGSICVTTTTTTASCAIFVYVLRIYWLVVIDATPSVWLAAYWDEQRRWWRTRKQLKCSSWGEPAMSVWAFSARHAGERITKKVGLAFDLKRVHKIKRNIQLLFVVWLREIRHFGVWSRTITVWCVSAFCGDFQPCTSEQHAFHVPVSRWI